jgi:hypothetical protein
VKICYWIIRLLEWLSIFDTPVVPPCLPRPVFLIEL